MNVNKWIIIDSIVSIIIILFAIVFVYDFFQCGICVDERFSKYWVCDYENPPSLKRIREECRCVIDTDTMIILAFGLLTMNVFIAILMYRYGEQMMFGVGNKNNDDK